MRARGLAGRGSIGARTLVRRDLIGRILCVPTGVCCRGDWEWQRNSRQGKRGRDYYKVVHTVSSCICELAPSTYANLVVDVLFNVDPVVVALY